MKVFYHKLNESVCGESTSVCNDPDATSCQKYMCVKDGVSNFRGIKSFLVSTCVYI